MATRGDIVYVDVPAPPGGAGHEQAGPRPALVVHNDATSPSLPVVMIIPFTGKRGAQRFPHTILVQPSAKNGLSCPSVLLVFQLRAIDKKRLRSTVGRLEEDLMDQAEAEMKALLSL